MHFSQTMVFACANEIGIAQTFINTRFPKVHFSQTMVFACANDDQVAQTIIFLVFLLPQKTTFVKKASFSLHFSTFQGLVKGL